MHTYDYVHYIILCACLAVGPHNIIVVNIAEMFVTISKQCLNSSASLQ